MELLLCERGREGEREGEGERAGERGRGIYREKRAWGVGEGGRDKQGGREGGRETGKGEGKAEKE